MPFVTRVGDARLLDLGWCTANLICGSTTENTLNDDEFAEPERCDGMTRNSDCLKTRATVKIGSLEHRRRGACDSA